MEKEENLTFEQAVMLLKEFDYEKNGKDLTIEFLLYMTSELVKIK